MWAMTSGLSFAQMSTFPAPPPLAPSPRPAPDKPSNDSSGMPATPDSSNAGDGTTAAPAPGSPIPAATPANANGPVTAATLSSMSALDDKIPLAPGDHISFRVIEDRDDAVPRVVTDTGEVDFPYIGRIKVAGKTCRQIAVVLKQLLEVDYYKRATVIVGLDIIGTSAASSPHDFVWVVGQVRQVGPQELSKIQPMTVSQVILRAGGFGEFADQRKVKIIHRSAAPDASGVLPPPDLNSTQDMDAQIIDIKSVFEGVSKVDPIVKPNDYIIVPKKWVNF
jgi:protein involved in polysaccharide export with SLBB domain